MINSYQLPESDRRGVGPYLATHAAQLRMEDLRAEAESAQLAKEYRRAHPELGLRYRVAVALRRLADRIAPQASATNPRPEVVRL